MKRFIINGSGSSDNESTDEELEEEVIEEVEEEDEGGGGGGGEVGREEEYEEEDSAENTSDEGRFVVMFDQATSPTPPSEISEPESMESTQEPAEDNTQPAAQVGAEARGGPRRGRTTAQISLDGINFGLHHLTPRAACEPSAAPGAAPSLRALLPAALALAVMLALQPLLHLPELNQLLHDAAAPHPHPFGAPPGSHPMDFLDSHLKIDINTGAGHSEVLQGNIRKRTYDLNAHVTHEIPMPNIVTNDTHNTQATDPTPGPSSAPTMNPRSGGPTHQEEQYSQRPHFTGGQDQNALATIMDYLRSIFGTYLLNFATDYHQIVSHLHAAFNSPQNRPPENPPNATPSPSGTFVPRVHHPESPLRAKRKATSTAEHASGMPKRISLHQPHPSVPENASQSVADPARPSTSTGLSGSTNQRKLPTRPKLKGILKSVRYEDSGKSTPKSRNKLSMSHSHARARASHSHERDTGQRRHSDAGISDPSQRSHPHPCGQRSGYDSRMSQGTRSMHQTHPGTHVPTCRSTSAPSTSTHSDPGTSRSQRESQEGPENVFTRAGPQFSSRPQDRERQESSRNLQQLAETEDEDWEEDSEDGSTGTNDSINANILYSSFVGSLREPQENFHGPQDLRTVRRDERVPSRPTVIFSSQITSGHHSRSSEGQESAGGGHRRSQLQTSDPHSSAHSLSTGQQRPPPTPHLSAPQQPPSQQHPPPTLHSLAPPQTPRQHQPPPTHSLAHPPSSVWQQTSHPTPHSSAGPQLPRHQQPHPTAQLQQIWIQKPFPIPHSSAHVQPTWIQGVPHPQYARYLQQPTGDYHRTDMGGISVPHQHYTGFNTHVSANGTYLQTGQPEIEGIVATHGVEHIIREQIVNGTLETIKEYSERMHNGTLSLYEATVAMSSMQLSANSQPSYGHGSQPSTSTTAALNTTYETAEYTENTMSQDTTPTSEHRRLSPHESSATSQSTIESSYELPEQTSRSTGTAQPSTIPPVHKTVDHSTSSTSSMSQNHNQLPNAHGGQTAGSRVNLAESSAQSSDWRPIQEPVAPVCTHTCNVPSVPSHPTHISNETSQSTMALVLSRAVQPVNDSSSSLNSTEEPVNGQSIHSPNKSATARQSIMVLVPVPINNLLGDSASALSYSVPSTYGPFRQTLGITSSAPQTTTALPVPIDNAVRNIPFVLHSDKPSSHGPLNPTSSGTDAVSQSAMDLIRILTDETTTSASAVDSNVPTVLDDSSETSNKTDSGSQSEMESVHVPIDRPMRKIGSAPHSNAKSANRRVDQTPSSTDNESQSDMTLIPADGISSSAVHCNVSSANGRSGQMRSKTDNTSQSLVALPPLSTNHRAKIPASALNSVENSAHGHLNPTPSLTAAVSEPTSLPEEPLELSKGKGTSVDQSTKLSSPEHTAQPSNKMATTSQPTSSSVCPRQDPPSPATMTDPVTPRDSSTRTASKVALEHHEQGHATRNPSSLDPVDEIHGGNDDSMISTEQIARILCEVRAASGARARSRELNDHPTGMFEQRTGVRLNDQDLGKIDADGTGSVKLQTASPGSDGDASISAHALDECEQLCGQTGKDQEEKQAGFGGGETDGDSSESDGSDGDLPLAVPAARRRAASPSPYQPPPQRARLDDRQVAAAHSSALDSTPQSMQRKTDADPPQCLSKPLAMWQTLDTQSQEKAQPEQEPLNLEVAAQATARGSAPTPSPARVSAGRPCRVQDSGCVTSPEADHARAPGHLGHACAPDEPHAQESAPGGQAQVHARDPGRLSVESSQDHAPGHVSDTGSSHEEVPLTQSHGHVRISSASHARNDVHVATPRRSEGDHDNPTRSVDAQVSDQDSHLEPCSAQDNDTMDEAVAATSITDGSVSTSQLSPNLPFDNVISPAVSPLAATPTAADNTDNESLSPSPGSATSDVASCSASLRGTTSSFVITCHSNSTHSFDFSAIKIKQEPKDFEPDSSDCLSEEGESSTTTLCVASTSLLVECANFSVPNSAKQPEIIIISKTSSDNGSTDSSNNPSSETSNLISTDHAQTVSSPKEILTADLPSIKVIAPNTKSDSSLCHGTTCDGREDTNSPKASTSTSDLRAFSIASLAKKIQQEPENDDEGVPGPSTGKKRKSPQRMFSGKRKTRTLNNEGGQDDSESDDNKESKKKMNEQKSKFKKRVKTKVKKKTKNEWVKNFKRNKCEKK